MFRIFGTIGKEKIARVKTIPPGFILNLTIDDTDYVITEVLKGSAGTAVMPYCRNAKLRNYQIAY